MTEGAGHGDVGYAKKVHIYSNGDKFFRGRRFVINPRHTRNFESFLTQVTSSLQPAFGAVRILRTPEQGHPVGDLNDLQTGQSYVACAQKFVKLNYNDQNFARRPTNRASPVRKNKVIVSGRIKKIERHPISIYVYTNGEILEPARRILLKPWVQRTWETVLVAINDKINLRSGAVRHLLELSTKSEVTEGIQLKNNEYYVAVGSERFKELEYGTDLNALSPRQQQKKKYPSLAPLKKKPTRSNASTDGLSGTSSTTNPSSLENSTNDSQKDKTPKPKRKAASQQPAQDEGIPIKPIKHKRGSGDKSKQTETKPKTEERKKPVKKTEHKKEVDLDQDDSGVYKSKTKKQKASEVKEDKKTKTEVPIDKQVAEEVEEEILESEDEPAQPATSPHAPTPEATNRSQPNSKNEKASSQLNSPVVTPTKSPTPPPKTPTPSPKNSPEPEEQKENSPTPVPQDDSTEREAAATKIQASYRGYKTRQELGEARTQEKTTGEQETDKEEAAATKIQATYRGYKTRKGLNEQSQNAEGEEPAAMVEQTAPEPKNDSEPNANDYGDEHEKAATKIQATYRGYQVRKGMKASEEGVTEKQENESDSAADGEGKQSEDTGAEHNSNKDESAAEAEHS